MEKLLRPQSVAIVGASETEGKTGTMIARNAIAHGYGGDVFFVNPGREEILGRRSYASIAAIGQSVDCAILAVPADKVYDVVAEAASVCQCFIVVAAGFAETGLSGYNREMRLRRLAEEKELLIVGPNCLGIVLPSLSLNLSFAPGLPQTGRTALITQSGALAVAVMDRASAEHYGFSAVVSIGNKMQVDEAALIDYFADDDATDTIALYMEGMNGDGLPFVRSVVMAREKGKRIVVLKSGQSQDAQRAVALHTGALAGSDEVFDAMLVKAGALRVRSLAELFAVLRVRAYGRPTEAFVRDVRVGIVTNAGGIGVLATDAVAATDGVTLAALTPETRDALRDVLPAASSVHNPVDVLGDALADRYRAAMTALLTDPSVDVVHVIVTPQAQTPVEEIAQVIAAVQETTTTPIVVSMIGGDRVAESIRYLARYHVAHVDVLGHVATALQSLRQSMHHGSIVAHDKPDRDRAAKMRTMVGKVEPQRALLFADEVAKVARAYGIPLVRHVDITKGLAADQKITYPCVAKVDDPTVAHKTDRGGVIVGIKTLRELDSARAHLRKKFGAQARVIVQPMAPVKMELLVGMTRDVSFGPVVVVGLGGIYTEALRVVQRFVSPLAAREVRAALLRGPLRFLFTATRGQEPYDVDRVTDVVLAIARMAQECPWASSADINPLLIYNDDTKDIAVDMKIAIDRS